MSEVAEPKPGPNEEQDSWLSSTLGINVSDYAKSAASAAGDAAEAVQDAGTSFAETVGETASIMADAVTSTVTPVVEAVETMAETAAETVAETAESVGHTVTDAVAAVKAKAEELAQTVQATVSEAAQDARDAASGVEKTVENAVDSAAKLAAEAKKMLDEAISSNSPVITIPDLGSVDVASTLDQAASQVVANNARGKLPFLVRAEALLEEGRRIVDQRISPDDALDLPAPTVQFTGECCTGPELNGFLNAIEGSRNGLQNSLNAYNDSQRAIEDACEQGKRICYGGLATCLVGMLLVPGPGKIAACLAGAVACIGGASPVQNAIRVQIKAQDDLKVAGGALERAIANYRSCYKFRCPELLPTDPTAAPAKNG